MKNLPRLRRAERPTADHNMKRSFPGAARQTALACCLAGFVLTSAPASNKDKLSADADKPSAAVSINRTVPKVERPKGGLQFSANPTVEEIFRARIFEEPLVPIGEQPNESENVDLVKALNGYAKRSGPDDF